MILKRYANKYFFKKYARIIIIASISIIDLHICEKLNEEPSKMLFCENNQYIDSQNFQCKPCNSKLQDSCDQCINQDKCLTCKYGILIGKECIDQNKLCEDGFKFDEKKNECKKCKESDICYQQICKDGFIFDESQKDCIKCKSDFCKVCNQNHHCLVCIDDSFQLTEDYTCQLKQNTDDIKLRISCPVGQEEKSGYCFKKSVCSFKYLTTDQQISHSVFQVIEFNDKILMFSLDTIQVYQFQTLDLISELMKISHGSGEEIITVKITKNYFLVLSNKFIYLYNLQSLKYINKQIITQNNQNPEQNIKQMFSNSKSDDFYYVSVLSSQPKMRVAHLEISLGTDLLRIKNDYIFFNDNKIQFSQVEYFQNYNLIIAINKQTVRLVNLSNVDKNNPDRYLITIPFEIIESIEHNKDNIFLIQKEGNLIFYINKSTSSKQYILKVIYNEVNKVIDKQTKEINWSSYLKNKLYQITQISNKIQQINQKVYISSQIGYQLSQNYSTKQELSLVIADLDSFFDSSNQELFYYQSDVVSLSQNKDIVNLFLFKLDNNLNDMKMMIAVNGEIKLYKIISRNDSKPKELYQKIFYQNNNNDNQSISFQQSIQEQTDFIISINSQIIVLSFKDTNKDKLSFRNNKQSFNELKEVYFSTGDILQVIVPQYLVQQSILKYSFYLLNFKNQRQFEIIQTISNYYGDIKVYAKSLINIQESEQLLFSISNDSFCSEDEQLIYVISSRGIYIIEFHTLRQINFISLFNYLAKNQNIIMSNIINQQLDNNRQDTISIQLVLMICEKGKCEMFIILQNFIQYLFSPNNQLHFIKFNPFNDQFIFVQYQNENQKVSNKIFVEKQEIQLDLYLPIQSVSFLSKFQFGFFTLDDKYQAIRINLRQNDQGKWEKNEEISYTFNEKLNCEQLGQRKFGFCFLNQNKEQKIFLFDWNKVKLISNTKDKDDNASIEHLIVPEADKDEYKIVIKSDFEYESSKVSDEGKKVLLILTNKTSEQQNGIRPKNSLFITFYFDPQFEIIYFKQEQKNQPLYWQIDGNSSVKQISGSDMYVYRQPLNQNHVRILFGDSNIAGGYIGIDQNYAQDNYSYQKQDNSLVYQDEGQVLVQKRIGEVKFSDLQINIMEKVLFSQNLGLMIVQKETSIQFIEIDTFDVQIQIDLIQPIGIVQIFWSEKFLTLLILNNHRLEGYDITDNFKTSKFNQTFEVQINISPKCFLFKIFPILACNYIGLYDFKIKFFFPNNKIFVFKKERDFKFNPPNLENKNMIITGGSDITTKINYLCIFNIDEKNFLDIQFQSIFFGEFLSHPEVDSQIFVYYEHTCSVFELINYKITLVFKNCQCTLNEYSKSLVISYTNTITVYKLPIYPNSQPITFSKPQMFGLNGFIINNYKITIQLIYDYLKKSSYHVINKIDLLSGKTTSQNVFLQQNFSYSEQYLLFWEEKDLLIFSNGLISNDDKRSIQIFSQIIPQHIKNLNYYSFRYNYIILSSQNEFATSLDISEMYPFNQKQNNLYNTLKVNNINYYFKNTNQSINTENNIDYLIFFNQKSMQVIKYYFVEKLKQELLFDFYEASNMYIMNDFEKSVSYKTPYIIVKLIDTQSETNNQIFGIYIQCQLIFFEKNKVLQIIDLIQYQCEIEPIDKLVYLINRKDKMLIQLAYLNNQITQLQIPLEIQSNLKIFDVRFNNLGKWILILYTDSQLNKQNQFQIIRNNQKNQRQSLTQISSPVSTHYFFEFENQQYLLIGQENSSIILYSLNFLAIDSEQIIQRIQLINTNKGVVYQFRCIGCESGNDSNVLNIYVTTKYRVFLYQANLESLKKISSEPLKQINQQYTHTRSYSLLKILGQHFIAIISQIQVTIFSQTLQYICRMEEKSFINVKDVFLVPDNNSFIIIDNNNIYFYNIFKINQRERLLLQQSISYKYPSIYKIENINKDDSQYIIYGAAIDSIIKIRYNPYSFNQDQDCLRYLSSFDTIEQQQQQYNLVLQESQSINSNSTIYLAINVQKSSQILLPDYIFNVNINQQIKNFVSLEIDLFGNDVELYQQINKNNQNILKQLKITNGVLVIKKPLLFSSMENVVFYNVTIKYPNEDLQLDLQHFPKLTFYEIEKLSFDTVTIENKINQMQLNGIYLFQLQKIQMIFIQNVLMLNQTFPVGLFTILQSYSINLSNFTMKGCNFDSIEPFINFEDINKIIHIKQINATEINLQQLFNFTNTQKIFIQNINLTRVNQTFEKSLRRLDIRKREQEKNIQEGNINKLSLINIVYNQNNCSLSNITVINSTLNILLTYSNELNVIQDVNENNINIKYISLHSNLLMQDIHIKKVKFKLRLIDAKENSIDLKNITISNNTNCQCKFYNSKLKIQIESFFFEDNILIVLPLLRFENSVIKIKTLQINNTQVPKQQNNIQTNGLIFIYMSNFTITDMMGINNGQSDYFIFIDTDLDEIGQSSIHDSKILNTTGGGIMALNLEKFTISYCQIENNTGAEKGGGLYLGNVRESILMNVQIKYNIASLSGGGIYLEESDLQIWKCAIQNNSAQIGGGIRYNNTVISPYFLKQNHSQISQNSANIFGNEFCSFPHHLEVVELTEEEIKFMNVSSEVAPSTFKNAVSSTIQQYTIIGFKLYDENNEIIKLYNETEVSKLENMNEKLKLELDKYSKFQLNFLEDEKQALISNKNEDIKYFKYHKFNFFAFSKFIAHSGYNNIAQNKQQKPIIMQMQIISEEKILLNSPDNKYIQEYQLNQTFSLQFRKCEKGEIIQKYLEDYYICWKCTSNTFSLDDPYLFNSTSQLKCKDCPDKAQNCTGNEIIPKERFWIEQGFDSLYECLNTEFACRYNQDTKSSCIEGYYGPQCESCDYENKQWGRNKQTGEIMKKYAKKGKFKCTECTDRISLQNQVALSLAIGLLFIAYLAYQINSNMEKKKLKYQAIYLKRCGLLYISNSIEQNEKTSVLIKIILSYMQLIMIINGFHTKIPEFFTVTFNLGNVMQQTAYSVDCLFVNMDFIKRIPIVYLRLMWTIVQPILYILILSIIFAIILRSQRYPRKKNLIISGLLKVYYMIFPQIVQQTVGGLSCRQFNNNYYILNDLQYECFDSNYYIYNFAVGLPSLIIIVLIPYFLYRQLKANSHQLNKNLNIFLSYGFFFAEFKKSYCFWEIIRLYEKILTYVVIGFFNQNNMISSIFMALIIILYMKIQIEIKPFTFNEFNNIDHLSQSTAIITILCMVMNSMSNDQYFIIITLIAVIFANTYFFYRIMLCFFSNILPTKVLKRIQKIQDILHNLYPEQFSKPKKTIVNIIKVTQNWKKIKVNLSKDKFHNLCNIQTSSLSISQNQNQNLTSLNKNNVPQIAKKRISTSHHKNEETDQYESIFQSVNQIKLQQFNSNQLTALNQNSKADLITKINLTSQFCSFKSEEEVLQRKKKTSIEAVLNGV